MKKRIIFTVINDLTYDQRMIRICKSLVENNYQVLLVGRKLQRSEPLQQQIFQQKRLNCFFEKGKLFYLEYNLRLFVFLLLENYDAVCAIDLDTILPAFYVSKIRKKKIIYDAHEYFTETPEIIRRPKVKRIWEWIARNTIPTCKYCYTVCQSLADIFKERYGADFQVVRNFPRKENLHLPKTEMQDFQSPKIILYQGALNEGRGLEVMIEAMLHIEEAEFWLAGEGDLSEELRNLTKELHLDEKVKFLGYVLPKDLKELTRKAFLGINLLENISLNYYYSLANKGLDYVQAEVPALNMNFPEYQKLNAAFEVSRLVENLDAHEISNIVNELLGNRETYQQLKFNCTQARKVWTWEEEEKVLLEFYSKVFKVPK